MEDVQDGRIKIRAHHWPTFLYDESLPFDVNNHDKGLLRGHFLLRVSILALRSCVSIESMIGISTYLYRSFFCSGGGPQGDQAFKGRHTWYG